MPRLFLLSNVLALTLLASAAHATPKTQTQRLGVPSVNLQLDKEEQVTLDGYCLDPESPPPDADQALHHVAASGVKIVVGSREVKLEEAISDNLITIRAHEKIVADIASNEMLEEAGLSARKWSALPVSKALKQLEKLKPSARKSEFRRVQLKIGLTALKGKGDGRRVVIKNRAKQKIKISSEQAFVVADHPFTLGDVDLRMVIKTPTTQWQEQQGRIWSAALLRRAEQTTDHRSLVLSEGMILGAQRLNGATHVLHGRGPSVTYRESNGIVTLVGDAAVDHYDKVYSNHLSLEVKRLNTASVIHVSPLNIKTNEIRMRIGAEQVTVTIAELETLRKGQSVQSVTNALAKISATAPIIIVRDGFAQTKVGMILSESRMSIPPQLVFNGLRQAYPKNNFYLDDDVVLAEANIARITPISGPSDVVLLSDKTSFPVQDHQVVAHIEQDLAAAGVYVIKDVTTLSPSAAAQIAAANVIVLTGHKDEAFLGFVDAIAAMGLLKGKSVAIMSCYDQLDPIRASRLIQDHGAREVIYFTAAINATAVEEVLVTVTQKFSGETRMNLFHALERAYDDAKPNLSETLRRYLDIMQIFMIRQVSDLGNLETQYYA
jgi:hypothetical protein